MSAKLFKTKGIVLRTVKYGETSLIVTIYTELFGLQSYLVNGVRTATGRSSGKANLFQPAALLDLVVYHKEGRSLNRIREFQWGHLYEQIFQDVTKNAVALFIVELLTHCLKQPEENQPLFQFTEDCLLHLDQAAPTITANLSLFFALHLTHFFGVSPRIVHTKEGSLYFDLVDSVIANTPPLHENYLEGKKASCCAELLKSRQPSELDEIKMNQEMRRQLLQHMEYYFLQHVQEFRPLKSLPVLSAVLH
ncbi:MAG: DNA repair protein RecO [Bacteroidota bacterium]